MEWQDRESDKITLTLSDYGTLQDRAVLRNVLDEMLKYRFTIDEKEVRAFEADEKKQELIIKGYKTLAEKQDDMITYLTELKRYRLRLCEADMKLDVVLPQQSN